MLPYGIACVWPGLAALSLHTEMHLHFMAAWRYSTAKMHRWLEGAVRERREPLPDLLTANQIPCKTVDLTRDSHQGYDSTRETHARAKCTGSHDSRLIEVDWKAGLRNQL